MRTNLDSCIITYENKGDDDKEDNSFFVCNFGDLSVHEKKVNELFFGPEGYYNVWIVFLVDIMVFVFGKHRSIYFKEFIIKKILSLR
jgi:hypothetical protein